MAPSPPGRLSLRKGEGEGEGLFHSNSALNGVEPLTLILSPHAGEKRKKRAQRNSNRKLLAHLDGHTDWPAGLRIDRTPECSRG